MKDNLVVEKLKKEHVKDVFEIEQKLIGTGSIEDIEKTFLSESLDYFVLLEKGKVVGFFEISLIAPEVELFDIAVVSECQGKGYASLMMEFLKDYSKQKQCDTIFLEVNKMNVKAIGLYEKFGFKTYAERKNYYGDNDAVLMKLEEF